MLTLRSFHLFFISVSIVLASGTGAWGLLNQHILLGALSLTAAVLLIGYEGYFVWKAEKIGLQ